MIRPPAPSRDAPSHNAPPLPLPLPARQRRLARRAYRGALLLYPRAFRRRFGDDLTAAFLDLLAEARTRRGAAGIAAALLKGLADVIGEATRERMSRFRIEPNNARLAPPGGMQLMVEDLLYDVRLALRSLRSSPGYAAAAVLTLALGIGANSAIFSVTEAALMSSAPVANPDSLVAVWTTCRNGTPRCPSSYPDYLDYRDRSSTLRDLAVYTFRRASLGAEGGARLISLQAASGNYFDLIGVDARLGRVIDDTDDQQRNAVVVLTDALWRDQFGADPDILGKQVRLNQAPFEVVGVLPEGFGGLHLSGSPDMFIPLLAGPALASGFLVDDSRFSERGSRWLDQLVGRLAPGATVEQARAEMLAISDQLAAEEPDARGPRSITVESARRMILPVRDEGELSRFVLLLGGVVAFTLLLACANLANLLLARTSARRREISIRLAIGAGKGRLVRQMLTESTVLALIGGVAALVVGGWVLSLLSAYQLPGGVAVEVIEAGIDLRVLLFTFGLAIATGLGFGLAPALQAARTDLDASMRSGDRGSSAAWGRLRGSLVAVQLALCLILVVGAGLFVQALFNGLDTDLGFAPEGVAVASLDLSLLHYDEQQGRTFVEALVERLESVPGVVAAGVGTRAPMLPGGTATILEAVQGYDPREDEELRLEFTFVSDGYLQALGLPLLEGRPLSRTDDSGRRTMVINRDMAERWWPGRSAVGGRVRFLSNAPREAVAGQNAFLSDDAAVGEVVGVAQNTKWDDGLTVPDYPFAYMPLAASDGRWLAGRIAVLARTQGDAAALLPVLRAEIATLEPDASLIQLATLESLLADVLMPQRMGTQLLASFAALALTLAMIGIYSVVAYSVSRRRRDLGIRIALGAEKGRILKLVVGSIMGPVIIGLLIGTGLTLLLARTLAGFLYGVSPTDPWTIGLVGGGLVVIAILASLLPARRATQVDPIVALQGN